MVIAATVFCGICVLLVASCIVLAVAYDHEAASVAGCMEEGQRW